jgi:4a-hydroxytetrahydrobiopterin dehydratase
MTTGDDAMETTLKRKDWSHARRQALGPTEIVTRLGSLPGWTLTGDGPDLAIEKTYAFANYYETISFVNAVAFIANAQDHHPDLSVHYNRCAVRFNTHDVKGLSETDFECAAQVDALLE